MRRAPAALWLWLIRQVMLRLLVLVEACSVGGQLLLQRRMLPGPIATHPYEYIHHTGYTSIQAQYITFARRFSSPRY